MPNHFHLVVEPAHQTALSQFMQWLLTSHVRRYHKHYGSSGHVWQGRLKSFAVQRDEHVITTLRYVLQNPVRAGLSETVHEWPWSSARRRQLVDRSPVDEEIRWSEQLESRLDELQVATIRECLNRQRPFGQSEWQTEMAVTFGLGSTLRPRGRPRSEKKKVACPPFNSHVVMDTSRYRRSRVWTQHSAPSRQWSLRPVRLSYVMDRHSRRTGIACCAWSL